MAFVIVGKGNLWYFNGVEYHSLHDALVAAWKTR